MASWTNQNVAQKQPSKLLQWAHLDIDCKPSSYRLSSIICTIGPATNSVEKLTELRKAGMSVVRLNFSHGSYEFHGSIIKNARESVRLYPLDGSPLAIALDNKGPEIRTGILVGDKDVLLEKGKEVTITTDDSRYENGDVNTIWVDYKNLPKVVPIGGTIYVDDGLISLEVLEKADTSVKCKILNTGKLGSRKGVNLPNISVDLPAISEKDARDLQWGVEQGVDIVFASFIRKASDVHAVREALGEKGKHIHIISKVENHEGMKNYDEILEASDGIMAARGDLGIEIPAEKVFIAQKIMVSRANIVGKPIICATHMLESMTNNPRPTRAEVSDVADAVLDNYDCVMLSGETAKGAYPVEAVTMMNKICLEAETAVYYRNFIQELILAENRELSVEEVTACAAVTTSLQTKIGAIIVLTTSGNSARLVSKYRPPCPIIAITRNGTTSRQLHLSRGVCPLLFTEEKAADWQVDVDRRINAAQEYGKKRGLLKEGDTVVVLQGWKSGVGHTNSMRILSVAP